MSVTTITRVASEVSGQEGRLKDDVMAFVYAITAGVIYRKLKFMGIKVSSATRTSYVKDVVTLV